MATFRDREGREWTVRVTVGTIVRVRDQSGVDLLEAGELGSSLFERLTGDPVLFWRVLSAVLRPQLDQRGVTPDQLADAMGEDEWEAAFVALVEGTIDFFREPKRGILRKTWAQARTAQRKVEQAAAQRAEAILESGDLQRQIERALAEHVPNAPSESGSSSGSSPASPDSTPGPAASASSPGPPQPVSEPSGTEPPQSSP